jgi:hypothetical protein
MILASLMKICSSVSTEIANIILISTESSALEIIRDFVALTIVAELDSIYASTMKSNSIREKVDNKILFYDMQKEKTAKKGFWFWLWTIVYQILRNLYMCVYYYFMPFLVPLICFIPFFKTFISDRFSNI